MDWLIFRRDGMLGLTGSVSGAYMPIKAVMAAAPGRTLGVALVLFGAGTVDAQTGSPFSGFELTPSPKTYLVVTDANVRAGPAIRAKRLTLLRKGVRVEAKGRAKGTEWIAVRRDGKDLGFVYKTVVAPLLDAKVEVPVKGFLEAKGQPKCGFELSFDGRTEIEDEIQVTADYGVELDCDTKGKKVQFAATMFVTEVPYRDLTKAEYQINVDLFGVPEDEENGLSIFTIYRPETGVLRFGGISDPDYASPAKLEKSGAKTVREALIAALRMAHRSWGSKVWAELRKR